MATGFYQGIFVWLQNALVRAQQTFATHLNAGKRNEYYTKRNFYSLFSIMNLYVDICGNWPKFI